jgi:valyl-tRNA synthetase
MVSKQWFVKIKPLAKQAIAAVIKGKTRIVPGTWEATYFEWMNNIRDWCISRQLWWGHRIPAFYCRSCGHITVTLEDPAECGKCGSKEIYQDNDVLDTWFSSALWPFSTLGWPEKTAALKKYYPTNVLVTGFDIIFFWVARMIMLGLKYMNDVPFRDVYIHALVRDEKGQKMSKSKGNVIDPLIMMERYGTDAFRFTLAILAAHGRDIILSEKRIEGYRAFCNKIWNATRFIMMNLGDDFTPGRINSENLENFDKWILHRLNTAIRSVSDALGEYKFNEAAQAIYEFLWHEFCDWYLELTKQRIYAKDESSKGSSGTAKQVLYYILKTGLRLLHPFMPYITEEIWSGIKEPTEEMLIISKWPEIKKEFNFDKEAEETTIFKEIIYKIRNIRGEMDIPPDRKANIIFKTNTEQIISIIDRERVNIGALAKIERIEINWNYVPQKSDAFAVIKDLEIFMPLKGLIDIQKERQRIQKEIEKSNSDLERFAKKLGDENFRNKAPQNIILKEEKKRDDTKEILSKLEESLAKLPAE